MQRGLSVGTLLLLVFCAGCGGPNVTRVSGAVKVGGAPVPAGSVTFVPDDPANENASGLIGPDGRYELAISAGVLGAKPGTYKVRIAGYKSMPTDMKPGKGSDLAIHRKYLDPRESKLTATVVAGPPQTIDFQLDGP